MILSSSSVTAGGTVQASVELTATSAEPGGSLNFANDVDAFISGATIASIDTNTCGAAAVTGVGTGLLNVSGGQIPGGGSCEIAYTINIPAGAAGGTFVNTTSSISAVFNSVTVGAAAVSDQLLVFGASAPEIAKSFSPSTVSAEIGPIR